MNIVKIIITFYFCVFTFLGLKAQKDFSFIREYIDFTIDSSYFTVNGIYSFANYTNQNMERTIIYPFPKSTHEITAIKVSDFRELKPIKFSIHDKSISFTIHIPAKDTAEVVIFYSQKVAMTNTYILTTTKIWGLPLEIANYTLRVKSPIVLSDISLPYDKLIQKGEDDLYYFYKKNFMPETDFIVNIRK